MTSSFRPDVECKTPSFVAHSVFGRARIDAGSESETATDFSPAASRSAEAERSAPAVSPEASTVTESEIAEREAAAYERGVEAARDDGARLEKACRAMEGAAQAWSAATKSSLGVNRALMLDLAQEIARRWVGAELQLDTDRFADVLERSLEGLTSEGSVTLRLNPGDLERMRSEGADRLSGLGAGEALDLEADGDLAPGEFLLDQGAESIDGRQEMILSRLRSLLEDSLSTLVDREESDVRPDASDSSLETDPESESGESE